MCGRYTIKLDQANWAEFLRDRGIHVEHFPSWWSHPRFNVAPTQDVPAITVEEDGPTLRAFRWGLIPSWSKTPARPLINARSETIFDKPTFRSAAKRRRCLILADGFYEWVKVNDQKQPHYIYLKSQQAFAFAGLYEPWNQGETPQTTCTILTCPSNSMMSPLHIRMPLILEPSHYEQWLDPTQHDREALSNLLTPIPASSMTEHRVSTYVNSPRNSGPECIEPLSP